MKQKYPLLIFLLPFYTLTLCGQIDANSLMGLPEATTVEMNNITAPNIGSVLFNTDDQSIYRYTTAGWLRDDDNQNAAEVPLVVNIDVNEGGTPSSTAETNVEEVIQAIAPITSKAGRVFYPPSIQIDASVNGSFSVNLYNEYVSQHTGAGIIRSTSGGVSAPDIPIYNANELYYYVTFADPAVFANISINGDTGEMSYDIIGSPVDFNSLINVVFVVK